MRTTEHMSAPMYAELVRSVVAWVQTHQEAGEVATYSNIARCFRLAHAEIDDIIGDSDAYGTKLILRAGVYSMPVGKTIVEIGAAE